MELAQLKIIVRGFEAFKRWLEISGHVVIVKGTLFCVSVERISDWYKPREP